MSIAAKEKLIRELTEQIEAISDEIGKSGWNYNPLWQYGSPERVYEYINRDMTEDPDLRLSGIQELYAIRPFSE